jgi:hypothetical protein
VIVNRFQAEEIEQQMTPTLEQRISAWAEANGWTPVRYSEHDGRVRATVQEGPDRAFGAGWTSNEATRNLAFALRPNGFTERAA